MTQDCADDRVSAAGSALTRGDPAGARSELEAALELDDGHAAAHANLALVLEAVGDSGAGHHHRRAVELVPAHPEIRFNLANWLSRQPGAEAWRKAREQYLAVLALDPGHSRAWNNLATLLLDGGYTEAAETALRAALDRDSRLYDGWINLGQLLLQRGQAQQAFEAFDTAHRLDPERPAADRGRAACCARLGRFTEADQYRRRGYAHSPLTTLPAQGPSPWTTLLILATADEGNIPWQRLIPRNHVCQVLAVDFLDSDYRLPPHDLVFNAIGDPDRAAVALDHAEHWAGRSNAPVINPPQRVKQTGRLALTRRVASIDDLHAPMIRQLPREALPQAIDQYPVLVRAPGYHGGEHFHEVCDPAALQDLLPTLPGPDLLLIEKLPTRSRDGFYRKYRVMLLGGQLYPLHLAIGSHWKVHYFSSEMAENPFFRGEEARFLDDFRVVLGPQACCALEALQTCLGLDYAGVDFALGHAGEVLLFEANATMVIEPPPDDPRWDYRRSAFQAALAAARKLFEVAG